MLIGTAKPMPMLPSVPPLLMMAVFMPIDLAAQVEQRTAGVARVDGRVGLNHFVRAADP